MRYLFVLSFLGWAWSQTHRCGTMERLAYLMQQDPTVRQRMEAIEAQTRAYLSSQAYQAHQRTQNVILIPVVVHIVYRTASENLSDAQVQSQIAVLNEDFRRLNADTVNTPSLFRGVAADAQIQFCLATRDPLGNPTSGITRTQTTKTSFSVYTDDVKFSSQGGRDAWPTDQYLNIWVCNLAGGVLGYAQFPGGGPASTDGVVIGYQYFGRGGSAQAPYNKGRTATHEVGHWLNLRHIWGDAQCGDDFVSDTPVQEQANYGCPSFPHPTCGNTSDMFMNFMDYTDDACMNLFTQGQKARMRAVLTAPNGYRASILSSQGCAPPGGGCSGTQTLTASSGTFSDGSGSSNYQNNSDCRWLIQPPNALSITLTFSNFSLLSGDSVIVYDGSTTSSPRLGAFSGSSLPPALTSSGGVMLVRFVTNGSGTANGFVASYTSQLNLPCYGTQLLTQPLGTITDGSGASNYLNNSDCKWVLQPGSGAGIRIDFTQFATESGYDFVTIYDGSRVDSRYLVRRFSGTNLPPSVTTFGPEATIYFTSDETFTAAGWSLNYSTISQPYCQGTVQLTAPSGTFSDGSGTSDYTNRATCRWLIQPAGATWIRLSFTSFNTESGYDFVRVYDGATMSAPLLGSFSGSSLPSQVTSSGGSMLVVFTSDSSVTRAGWEASYTSNGTTTTLGYAPLDRVRYYPVPAREALTIEVPGLQPVSFEVYDSQGRRVWEGILQPGENHLPLSGWPQGLYLGVLSQEGTSVTLRFVRE